MIYQSKMISDNIHFSAKCLLELNFSRLQAIQILPDNQCPRRVLLQTLNLRNFFNIILIQEEQ